MPQPRDDGTDGGGSSRDQRRNRQVAPTVGAAAARSEELDSRRYDRDPAWNDPVSVAFWRGMYFALVIEVVCAVAAGVGIYFAVNYL